MKESSQRTCIGCRQVRPKAELLRLVCAGDGRATLDRERVAPGRGAYACPTVECLKRALDPGRLARALRVAVHPSAENVAEILQSWRRR